MWGRLRLGLQTLSVSFSTLSRNSATPLSPIIINWWGRTLITSTLIADFCLFFFSFFIKFKYETLYLIKINSVAHYSREFLDGSLMIGMLLGDLVGFEFFHFLHVFHLPFSLFLFFWIKFFILLNRLFDFILIDFRFIFILWIKILEPFSIVCVALLVISTIPRLGPDSTHPHDSSCLLWTFFYPIHLIRRHDVSQFVLYVSRQITDYWFIQRLIVLLHCC